MTLIDDHREDATAEPAANGARVRQQVLVLYLANSSLDARVIAWSAWDGTGRTRPTAGDADTPPYATGVDALVDGWRLFQVSPLLPPYPGHEYDTSFLRNEFFFEKLVS